MGSPPFVKGDLGGFNLTENYLIENNYYSIYPDDSAKNLFLKNDDQPIGQYLIQSIGITLCLVVNYWKY